MLVTCSFSEPAAASNHLKVLSVTVWFAADNNIAFFEPGVANCCSLGGDDNPDVLVAFEVLHLFYHLALTAFQVNHNNLFGFDRQILFVSEYIGNTLVQSFSLRRIHKDDHVAFSPGMHLTFVSGSWITVMDIIQKSVEVKFCDSMIDFVSLQLVSWILAITSCLGQATQESFTCMVADMASLDTF